jgi:coproporphyrinogen III oxidase
LDYTYDQLIGSLNLATLPVYVDEASEGLDKSFGSFQIGSNRIPTQKHRYPVSAKMMREQMIMYNRFGAASLTGQTRDALRDLLFDSTDKLIAGNRNALTHQRMKIASTGQFTIDLENNPRGLKGLTFDFGVKTKETLTTTARWWTNAEHTTANEGSASDPLLYLKNKAKAARKAGYPAFHFEMAQDLFDDLLMHSAVLKRIGFAAYPAATDATALSYAQNMTDEAKKDAIQRIVGVEIKTYDSLAAVEKFDEETKGIKPVTIENFKSTNVSLVPNGQIGTIKSVQPMVFTDDPTQRIAWFDGGRTLITNRFESKTKTMYVESEMAVLCVPNMPQYMQIYTVTV